MDKKEIFKLFWQVHLIFNLDSNATPKDKEEFDRLFDKMEKILTKYFE